MHVIVIYPLKMTSHLKIQIFSDIFDFFLMYKQKESYIIQTNLFILYIHSFFNTT